MGFMARGRATANHMLPSRISGAPAAAAPFVVPKSVPTGAGEVVFEFHDPASRRARPMRVFAYFPEAVQTGEPTNVLFVMHGVNRNAEETFRRIVKANRNPLDSHVLLPEKYNFVLLVPEFSKELFPGRNAYNFGNVFQVRPLQACCTRHVRAHFGPTPWLMPKRVCALTCGRSPSTGRGPIAS